MSTFHLYTIKLDIKQFIPNAYATGMNVIITTYPVPRPCSTAFATRRVGLTLKRIDNLCF